MDIVKGVIALHPDRQVSLKVHDDVAREIDKEGEEHIHHHRPHIWGLLAVKEKIDQRDERSPSLGPVEQSIQEIGHGS